MPRCFENGNGDFGPEAFRAIHCAQLSTNGQAVSWFYAFHIHGFLVSDPRSIVLCCQWVALRFGRVCIAKFIQCNQCTMFIRKNKVIIIILQPVDGATDGATRRVICPASTVLWIRQTASCANVLLLPFIILCHIPSIIQVDGVGLTSVGDTFFSSPW